MLPFEQTLTLKLNIGPDAARRSAAVRSEVGLLPGTKFACGDAPSEGDRKAIKRTMPISLQRFAYLSDDLLPMFLVTYIGETTALQTKSTCEFSLFLGARGRP